MSTQLLDDVEAIIEARVRPVLRLHGGEIQIDSLNEDGVLGVRLMGACVGCPAADLSMQSVVRHELLGAVEGIRDVVLVGSVSDSLLSQARQLLGHRGAGVPIKLLV